MTKKATKPSKRKAIKHPVTGKRIWIYYKTEGELYRKLRELNAHADERTRFKAIAYAWWVDEVERLSPSTEDKYRTLYNRAIETFGDMYIDEIKTSDISRYLTYLGRKGYARKTVKNHLIVVSRIMHYAVTEGLVPFNPARDAEVPRGLPERRRTAATPTEEQNIKALTKEAWLLPVMAIYTGMRKGELIGLKWGDIDLTRRTITVQRSIWYGGGTHIKAPKTDAGVRTIPIMTALYDRLQTETPRIAEHYVFGGEKPLTEKRYRVLYAQFQEQAGVSCTLHQLRKSFATYAVERDLPPDVLKAILGHKDISTTLNIYAETRASRITGAIKMLE